jgi:hypothetical protein
LAEAGVACFAEVLFDSSFPLFEPCFAWKQASTNLAEQVCEFKRCVLPEEKQIEQTLQGQPPLAEVTTPPPQRSEQNEIKR